MKRLSRIEAVNQINSIRTADRISTESELSSIPQAASASEDLDIATIRIQTDFIWYFNSIDEGILTSDSEGLIATPDNLAQMFILSTDTPAQGPFLRPVGGYIYDTYNHTNNHGTGRTIRYTGKMIWDFEDLPVAFQFLAIAQVRKEIAGSKAHFSPQRLAVETQNYQNAQQTAMKFDNFLSGQRFRDPADNRRRPPHNQGFV